MNGKDAMVFLRFILVTVYIIFVNVSIKPCKKVKAIYKDSTEVQQVIK